MPRGLQDEDAQEEDEEVPEEEGVLPMEVAEGGAGNGPGEQAAQPDDQQGKTAHSPHRLYDAHGGTAGASQRPVAVCI